MTIEAAAATPPPATPAEAPPPDAPEPEAQPRNAVERIVAKHQKREAEKAKEAPPAEGKPPAAESDPKPKAEPEKPKEEGSSLQFAKAKQELRQLTAANVELKGKAETLTKELDDIKKMVERNPFKAMEKLAGKPFKELVERASKGEFDERNQLPPEAQEKLNKFEAWQKEQEAKAAEAAKAAERADDVKFARSFLEQAADTYPIFGAAEWAADELVDRAYAEMKAGKKPEELDLGAIAKELEDTAMRNLESLFTNKRILSTLAKRANLRQAWSEASGLSEQQTAARPASSKSGESNAGNGPRTLSHTTTQESPIPVDSSGEEDESDWLDGARMRWRQLAQHGRIVGR